MTLRDVVKVVAEKLQLEIEVVEASRNRAVLLVVLPQMHFGQVETVRFPAKLWCGLDNPGLSESDIAQAITQAFWEHFQRATEAFYRSYERVDFSTELSKGAFDAVS